MITFFVQGHPVPCARPRFSQGRVYIPSKTRTWQNTVAWAAKAHRPDELMSGSLYMQLNFHFKKPKSIKKDVYYCIGKSDIDNYAKSVMDALHNIFYKNDNQIVRLHCIKVYGNPGVEITVGKTNNLV